MLALSVAAAVLVVRQSATQAGQARKQTHLLAAAHLCWRLVVAVRARQMAAQTLGLAAVRLVEQVVAVVFG